MKILKRILTYPVPYWLIALILITWTAGLIVFYALPTIERAQANAANMAASACPATYTLTVHDVIEAQPEPGIGRIVWTGSGGKRYQHDFPTAKSVGDEVFLKLVFDCLADSGTTELLDGCTCKRVSTTDLMETQP